MYAREMIRTHPKVQGNMSEALVQCLTLTHIFLG